MRAAAVFVVQTAATNLCFQTMATIVPVILNQTNTDTLTSPSLLTPNATQRAYEIYVGNTVVTQVRPRWLLRVSPCRPFAHGSGLLTGLWRHLPWFLAQGCVSLPSAFLEALGMSAYA